MFSQQNSKSHIPGVFACPFYNTDPVEYHKCSHIRLGRPSDVSWHLERRHTLQEEKLCTAQGAEAALRNGKEKGPCTDPKHIKVYCTICRLRFLGRDAEVDLERHQAESICQLKTIEETGMLLPKELERVVTERSSVTTSPEDKWYAMWNECFPPLTTTRFRNVPASPYVQITAAREAAETHIRQVLGKLPISMDDRRSAFDEIVSVLYPVQFGADAEVKKIVNDQQIKRTSALQEAEFDEFCRSTLGSSEVTTPGVSSTDPVHHEQPHTMEQVDNGTMSLSSLLPREPQPLQPLYPTVPTVPSYFRLLETQIPSQVTGSASRQYMEVDGYAPSEGYTGGFSDGY
ncbi:ankyrin protein [Fusarium pseudoanthophilum]|uniref:Ankyrin protein n=1 Tax=Fusarium pseudoanthophilum TaxID=48495 RepID=A0A8H5KHF5_9HYPO|nr:ankyrin protein [Fusarium pseudoanthophilum]